MTSGFETKTYTFDLRPEYPLLSVAKRYWRPDSPHRDDPTALTLFFAHAASFHKELWEPTIDDLQAIVARHGVAGPVRIREIWAIDAPNHGDAALINEEALRQRTDVIFGWEQYGRCIHMLLSGLGKGIDVDFTQHRIVGIGHSMGAVALALAMEHFPKVRFEALILCEVMIMAPVYGGPASEFLTKGAATRRDCWPSKEEAYKLLKARGTWKTWDERVLRGYVEHGMYHLPTAEYPNGVGVTLKCTRKQEAACYRDSEGAYHVYTNFKRIVQEVPTHLIYGAIDDYLVAEIKKDVVENAAGGLQNLASFSRVEGAGHLVIQANPSGLASKIFDALSTTESHSKARL